LQVFAARIYRHAENGVLLPNAAAARVIRARLSNGAETLFLALERDILHSERGAEEADRYFTWLARQLALRGRRLLVVLAPQKYTVYAPLLQAPDPGPEASVHYLAEVERRLAARGIAVVDLVEPLRAAARSALEADSLIYWGDDTHWNAAGNDIAARVIAPALERLWDEAK
jgi:lysophospholipase L1-like esterase